MISVFFTFVLLGFFSFGGGYAFLPLMESQLVERMGWITREQFVLSLTAGQISPGPVAVAGTFAGYLIGYNQYQSFWGGLLFGFLAWVGTNVATFLSMSIIMRGYDRIANHQAIPHLLEFVMPAVIGLILYLALKMGFDSPQAIARITTADAAGAIPRILIGVVAFISALTRKIDYAIIIIGSGILGYFLLS